jgi:hypothetical protein
MLAACDLVYELSTTANTMGMSPPARRIARSGGEPTTKITSHARRTNSVAWAGKPASLSAPALLEASIASLAPTKPGKPLLERIDRSIVGRSDVRSRSREQDADTPYARSLLRFCDTWRHRAQHEFARPLPLIGAA